MEISYPFKPDRKCLDPFVCRAWGYCLYGCKELRDYVDSGCVKSEINCHSGTVVLLGLTGAESERLLNGV